MDSKDKAVGVFQGTLCPFIVISNPNLLHIWPKKVVYSARCWKLLVLCWRDKRTLRSGYLDSNLDVALKI